MGEKDKMRLYWARAGPKINDWHLSKEEGGTHSNHKEEGYGEDGGRDWSSAAMNQGLRGAIRN